MDFNEYLKVCRAEVNLTQEGLVHELYSYDIDNFQSLDTSTLSKWERGITKPKGSKQVSIMQYFQEKTGIALPCWHNYSVHEAEELICQQGIHNLIGKSKRLFSNFPSDSMQLNDLKVANLRHFDRMDTLLAINMDLHQDTNHPYMQISLKQFKEWSLHPSNLFLACEYKNAFLGLMFTVRLKPNIFDKILHFEMKKDEITLDDFASFDEMGCNFILSFYALNEKAATALSVRYYAHLIANQDNILEVGAASAIEDIQKVILNINLAPQDSKHMDDHTEIITYKQSLANVLISPLVVKMLFPKHDCPET